MIPVPPPFIVGLLAAVRGSRTFERARWQRRNATPVSRRPAEKSESTMVHQAIEGFEPMIGRAQHIEAGPRRPGKVHRSSIDPITGRIRR